jgi:YggT family protein
VFPAVRAGNVLVDLGEIYFIILIVRMLLSWFPYDPMSPFNGVRHFIFTITEPVLAPFRRLIPPIGMIDISFIVALIVVQIVITQILSRIPI